MIRKIKLSDQKNYYILGNELNSNFNKAFNLDKILLNLFISINCLSLELPGQNKQFKLQIFVTSRYTFLNILPPVLI